MEQSNSAYLKHLESLLSFTEHNENLPQVLKSVKNAYPNIGLLFSATPEALKQTTRLSNASIDLISLNKAIAKKLDKPTAAHQKLNTTTLAKDFCMHIFEDDGVEQFFCLCLDDNCRLVNFSQLSYGNFSNANLRMKQITESVFKSKCKNIIICHNHPDGLCMPSEDDIMFTKRLCLNMMLNNINLLDHIVLTTSSATSMLELGLLTKIKLEIYNNNAIPNKKANQQLLTSGVYKVE